MALSSERDTKGRQPPPSRDPASRGGSGRDRPGRQTTQSTRSPRRSSESADPVQRSASRARRPVASVKKVPGRSNQSRGNRSAARPPAGNAAGIPRAGDKQQPPANRRRTGSSRGKRKNVFGKYLGHFKHTGGLLFKKSLRNLILYPVAILALYPLLVFKHIYFMILYLFLWTNIVLGVAIFLDELFDLPRKR